IERARRGSLEIRTPEHARRDCHTLDHETVPAGENLLVAAGPHAFITCAPQLFHRALQDSFDFGGLAFFATRDLLQRLARVQVPMTFEVGRLVEPETPLYDPVLVPIQQALDLLLVPHVETPLVAFRVGIEARVVATFR